MPTRPGVSRLSGRLYYQMQSANRREFAVMKQLLVRASTAFSLLSNEDGQALVEYMLLLALISIAVIGVLTVLGTVPSSIFSRVNADFH